MQKRGVIVDEDDFLPILTTYPDHPLSKEIPKVKTFAELQQMRRNSNRNKIELANTTFEANRMQYIPRNTPYIYSDFNIEKPTFTSIKQRIELEKQNARKKVNLTDAV